MPVDGSHDKLPAGQAAAVDRTLRHYGLMPPAPVKTWNPMAVLLIWAAIVGLCVACGVGVYYGTRDQGVIPDVVVITTTPTPTPYPGGWVPR